MGKVGGKRGRVRIWIEFAKIFIQTFPLGRTAQTIPLATVNVRFSDLDLLFSSNQRYPFYPSLTILPQQTLLTGMINNFYLDLTGQDAVLRNWVGRELPKQAASCRCLKILMDSKKCSVLK